jgi:hypothetical protein
MGDLPGGEIPALIALISMRREQVRSDKAATAHSRANVTEQQARVARGLSEDAAAQSSSLLLEQWGSMLLGAFWRRQRVCGPGLNSWAASGEPVLASIAAIGNADAKLALLTLG